MRKLRQKGLQAETHLKAKEAQLAAAYAERKRLEIDLARTTIRAPFDGVLETREPEIGTLLEQGDVVAEIVDQSVVKAVGYVPQHSENAIALGQKVQARLLDGREASGHLTYIAPVAESGTRSFRVEAEIPNAEALFNAGVSVEIRIAVGMQAAHFVSAAILALDDDGRIGVKALAADDTIEFYPVEVMRTTADGIWVTGLPASLRVVTRGQGFVVAGETVNPVPGG
jgi:multidrug efflux system membrane fusion protein